MLAGDLRRDYVRTTFARLVDAPLAAFQTIFETMEEEGRAAVASASAQVREVVIEYGADMRYIGQEHAVAVDLPAEVFLNRDTEIIKARFDAVHQQRYGFSALAEGAEIVSLRLSVTGVMPKPPLERIPEGGPEPDAALISRHDVFFDGFHSTPVYSRPMLRAGNRIMGPALIEEHASTTIVFPGDTVTVDGYGNLIMEVRSA
jgi:N-methylhydantoinase A